MRDTGHILVLAEARIRLPIRFHVPPALVALSARMPEVEYAHALSDLPLRVDVGAQRDDGAYGFMGRYHGAFGLVDSLLDLEVGVAKA